MLVKGVMCSISRIEHSILYQSRELSGSKYCGHRNDMYHVLDLESGNSHNVSDSEHHLCSCDVLILTSTSQEEGGKADIFHVTLS